MSDSIHALTGIAGRLARWQPLGTVLNEHVAYVELSQLRTLSERCRTFLTYALCAHAGHLSAV